MKQSNRTVPLSIATIIGIAGFIAGLMGSNFVSPAYAAGNSVIKVTSAEEIAARCNFDKTMVLWGNGYLCVQK